MGKGGTDGERKGRPPEFSYCSTWGVHVNHPAGRCHGKMVTVGAAAGAGRRFFSQTRGRIPEGNRVSLFWAGTLGCPHPQEAQGLAFVPLQSW